MRYRDLADADCSIAQALAIVGDWWSLLVVRDVAGGHVRFDDLQRELGVSRKVLAERLRTLVAHDVLERRPYRERPLRHEYRLTARGRGLLPVLVALQDWGSRHVLGDGAVTATAAAGSDEARRVHALVGTRLPALRLPAVGGGLRDPAGDGGWTALYAFPGAFVPGPRAYPPGWDEIPGAPGCTIESRAFRDRLGDVQSAGARVVGVSTQRLDELTAFAEHEHIPFPLLSDSELVLAASLRLPTFRAGGAERLKRVTLILGPGRTVHAALYPVDPAGSVDAVLRALEELQTSG